MLAKLDDIEKEITSFSITGKEELETFRLRFLSRKSTLSGLFDELKNIDKSERPAYGKRLNDVKKLAEEKYEDGKNRLDSASLETKEQIDLSMPGRMFSTGREHILIQTLNDFIDIFRKIGFSIADGPEIEDEFHNFDALNTPEYHPVRDIQDTFYVINSADTSQKYLLRTHTSPIQIRTMMSRKPPIRIVAPGRAYRNETVTMKNYFTFLQVECLYVDKNVSMRDLKGILSYFVKQYFGEQSRTRFRPSFFPFTEPSAELDMSCFICKGEGCRTCKYTGWIELGGCGMVDPNVFKAVGYDPEVYSGYAFGFGIERIAMMKYGISDIRLFYQNDIRFLDQF
jgi:phenylalanyl-tRNA synthetase alpha chain